MRQREAARCCRRNHPSCQHDQLRCRRQELHPDSRLRCGCSVILSIFWNLWMFADLHGEPLRAMLTNASSSSHQASLSFARTLAQRYSSSPALFAWEIGNEHNLLTDLDCSGQTWGCAPSQGTPAARTAADSSSSQDYLAFQSSIVAVIRQPDAPVRPISSGHSLPRPSAFHLMRSFPRADWTPDSVDQVHRWLTPPAAAPL